MAQHIEENTSATFFEYRLLPRYTGRSQAPDNIDLRTQLCKGREHCEQLYLNVPLVSAAMQAVSGSDMAISLAREGGMSFIFCSQPIEEQAKKIRRVKNYKAGFVRSDSNLTPQDTLKDVTDITERTGHSTIAVTVTGENDSELLGIITDMDYWPNDPPETPVKDIMTPISELTYGYEGLTLKGANELLRRSRKSCIPIVNNEEEKRLRYLVFKKDYIMQKHNPLQLHDEDKRLMVGAAINTHDYEERVPALVESGVDALCIDSSDGYSEFVAETLEWVQTHYPSVPIGAGNIVTEEAFNYLARQGADFIKVGIGGGSICITQEQKGIGRGQATALKHVVSARDTYYQNHGTYIPLCSDGGLVQDSHVLMALAFGADFVMMGRYFARFRESPTPMKEVKGELVKPYWGEGSERARNWQRYFSGSGEGLKFEEGVDGYVPYAGGLKENIDKTLAVIKSTMGNVGTTSVEELHNHALIERVSAASMREGKAHDIILPGEKGDGADKTLWG